MASQKKKAFSIKPSSNKKAVEAKTTVKKNNFVSGKESEITKTFMMPTRLAKRLKIHAAMTDQTEKEILGKSVVNYLDEMGG